MVISQASHTHFPFPPVFVLTISMSACRAFGSQFNWPPVREFRLFTTAAEADFMAEVAVTCTLLPTFGQLWGDAKCSANFWASTG